VLPYELNYILFLDHKVTSAKHSIAFVGIGSLCDRQVGFLSSTRNCVLLIMLVTVIASSLSSVALCLCISELSLQSADSLPKGDFCVSERLIASGT
jgi:hypothetical protein